MRRLPSPFALPETVPLEMNPRAVPALPCPDASWTVLMPFVVDDRFHSHRKVAGLSLAARGLWVSAGSWSADHGTAGRVDSHVIASLGGTPELVAELVRKRMWRRLRKDAAIEFHDWEFWNGAPAAAGVPAALPSSPCPAPTAGARRVALHRVPGLKQALRARDADQCRYCAQAVRWGRGRAADSAVWDWVEPEGPASPENVVVACKACSEAKAGRSLKDSGMVLLPVPVPGKRNASCNASDLGKDNSNAYTGKTAGQKRYNGNASRNAYTGDGNAYTGKTAGQKRYGKRYEPDDRSDLDLSSPSGSEPVPVATGRARARKPKPGTSEFQAAVTAKFAARTQVEITAQQADALAAEVLGHAADPVPSPLGYVLTAIDNERDPIARWLPGYARSAPRGPAEDRWCGKCIEDDRGTYDEHGKFHPCPDCHPKFRAIRRVA